MSLIARVTSHIPDKGQVMIRYYGYSNAHRGKVRKAGAQPSHAPIIEDGLSYVSAKGWAKTKFSPLVMLARKTPGRTTDIFGTHFLDFL